MSIRVDKVCVSENTRQRSFGKLLTNSGTGVSDNARQRSFGKLLTNSGTGVSENTRQRGFGKLLTNPGTGVSENRVEEPIKTNTSRVACYDIN